MKATFDSPRYDSHLCDFFSGTHEDLDERQVRVFAKHLVDPDPEAAAIIADELGLSVETPKAEEGTDEPELPGDEPVAEEGAGEPEPSAEKPDAKAEIAADKPKRAGRPPKAEKAKE
jgi:hypothetical protein